MHLKSESEHNSVTPCASTPQSGSELTADCCASWVEERRMWYARFWECTFSVFWAKINSENGVRGLLHKYMFDFCELTLCFCLIVQSFFLPMLHDKSFYFWESCIFLKNSEMNNLLFPEYILVTGKIEIDPCWEISVTHQFQHIEFWV